MFSDGCCIEPRLSAVLHILIHLTLTSLPRTVNLASAVSRGGGGQREAAKKSARVQRQRRLNDSNAEQENLPQRRLNTPLLLLWLLVFLEESCPQKRKTYWKKPRISCKNAPSVREGGEVCFLPSNQTQAWPENVPSMMSKMLAGAIMISSESVTLRLPEGGKIVRICPGK